MTEGRCSARKLWGWIGSCEIVLAHNERKQTGKWRKGKKETAGKWCGPCKERRNRLALRCQLNCNSHLMLKLIWVQIA